ncbi:protein D3-like isoform X1 [Anopheles albimanus]|uniref:protein D3-like isoform X1 n=1 Tax=Anopheles albimanus TaxID=7167 RepID=UPI00163FAF68|nr:protein D3-like isoform X1 [Anopheles albimanus]
MMLPWLQSVLVFAVSILCSSFVSRASDILNDAHVYRSFASYEVVPDVIDEAPDCWARVSFKSGRQAEGGNRLTPTQIRNPPVVTWNANERALYSLIMTDPDVPSRDDPRFREFIHWAVGNIPGNDIDRGETLVEYLGAITPRGTGLHRFVVLVFEHLQKLDFTGEPRISNQCGTVRRYFSTRNFTRKYDLNNLYAGNFFQTHYDDYVPTLQAQLRECEDESSLNELNGQRNGTVFGGS